MCVLAFALVTGVEFSILMFGSERGVWGVMFVLDLRGRGRRWRMEGGGKSWIGGGGFEIFT